MLKTNGNKPIIRRKGVYKVASLICVLAMLINPLGNISYADSVQDENHDQSATLIQEEQGAPAATGSEAEVQEPANTEDEGEAPADIETEDEGQAPADIETEDEGQAPADIETEDEGEAPADIETEDEGEAPADIETEDEGQAPADIETEDEGEAPADIETEDEGQAPADIETEDEGQAPADIETEDEEQIPSILPQSMEAQLQEELLPMSVPSKPEIVFNTSEWSQSVDVTINGTVPDGGVIQYCIDSNAWQDYTETVSMTEEGIHTVSARVVSGEGESEIEEAVYRLDKTSPEISVSCTADGDARIADVTVTDEYSGVSVKKYASGNRDKAYFATGGEAFNSTFSGVAGSEYTVFAEDACGNSEIQFFIMNTAPTLSGLPDRKKLEVDTVLSLSFHVFDEDTDAEDLIVEVTADDTALFPNSFDITNTDGSCSAESMPASGLSGSTFLTVSVSDGELTTIKTVNITPNNAPNAVDDSAVVDENDFVEIKVLDNDSDSDGDDLIITDVTGMAFGTAVISSDLKSVTYTPTPEWNGSDLFTYTIIDTSGATASATVSVTVNPVKEGPQIALNTSEWTNHVMVTITGDVPAGGSIQYRVGSGDWELYSETVPMTEEGECTLSARIVNAAGIPTKTTEAAYKLDCSGPDISIPESWDGSDSQKVSVLVSDNYTAVQDKKYAQGDWAEDYFEADGILLSDTITVEKGKWYTLYAKDSCGNTTVKRFTLNTQQPEISDITDVVYGTEDTELSFTFNVSDAETNAGDLSVSITADDKVLFPNGFTIVNNDGTCTATSTPGKDQSGSSLLTITVSDGVLYTEKEVTAEISAESDSPVASPDAVETNEDEAVTADVLANDTDADGDDLIILSASVPNHGAADVSSDGKTILYSPEENFNGTDTFEYMIEDSSHNTATATVTVTVAAVNDAPSAIDDNATTNKNMSVDIDVLANDSDIDGDIILISEIPEVNHGTVTIGEGGLLLTYTPEENWYGTDTFTYLVEDDKGAVATATVTVTVVYLDYPPVVSGLLESYEVEEDQSITIEFELADDVTDNQSITAQVTSSDNSIVSDEKITVDGLGDSDSEISLSITPESNQFGPVTITVRVSDGFNIAIYTFTLNVLPVNDAPVARNDAFTFTEDYTVSFTEEQLLANDVDIDDTALQFAGIVTNVQKGDLDYNSGTGTFTYTPETNLDTDVSFTYLVSDGELESSNTATVALHCIPVNDEPWLTDISDQETQEDTPISGIEFHIGDPETDTEQLILTMGSSAQNVVSDNKIIVSGTGEERFLTIAPNTNGNGETTISVTVSDGEYYITKSFKLTVVAVQDPPTALDDIAVVRIKESVIIPVLDNDFDVDGDAINITSVENPAHGNVTVQADGTITYVAHSSYVGIDTFTYTINDGNGNEATATAKVSCSDNQHPPILSSIPNQSIEEDGTTGAIPFSARDLQDLSTLVMTKSSGNPDLIDESGIIINKISDSSYTVTVTPQANESGRAVITITATDSFGYTFRMDFLVIVHPVNDKPVAANDTVVTNEDIPIQFNVLTNDSDLESSVSVLSMGSADNGELVWLGGGNYRYTPNEDWNGTETISYAIMDSDAETASAEIAIQVSAVNDPPVAMDDYGFGVDFGSPYTINVLGNDYDIDEGSSISIQSCSFSSATINQGDGTITFPANSEYSGGWAEYTYTIIDNEGETDSAAIRLTSETGGPWFYLYEVSRTIKEDSPTIEINLMDSTIIANHTSGTLTLGLSSESGETASLGIADIEGNILRYTPLPDKNGTDVFYFTATFGSEIKKQKITMNIQPVNDAPTITTVSDIGVDEDVASGIPDVEVTINDVDNSFAELTFAAGSSNQSAITSDGITVIRGADGKITLRFSFTENANGDTIINMKVSDGIAFAEESFAIRIQPINDIPSALDISKTLDEDTNLYFNLIGSEADPDIGDALSAELVSGPYHGTVTIDEDGIAYYIPEHNYNGNDSFVFKVKDSNGGEQTGTAYLTVRPVYDPTAILYLPETVSTTKNKPVSVSFEIPNPDNATITVHMESANSNLVDNSDPNSFNIQKTGISYSAQINPVTDASGNGMIVVKADDGTQEYAATFTLYVTAAEGDVNAVDDIYTINEDTVSLFNVTGNDTDSETDPLSVISFSNPSHGTVVNNLDGTLTYKPSLNYFGSDSFQYTVSDSYGNTDQAAVTITILPVNDPPTARNDSITIEEDTSFNLNVVANDSDVEGDPITLIGITQPSHGTATFSDMDGKVSYTPNANYSGSDSFTYTISDGTLTSTAVVSVIVAPLNDPPVILEVSGSTWIWELYEDTPDVFSVAISDAETVSNNLLVKITSTEKNLIADSNIKATRSGSNYNISLTPSPDQYGDLKLNIEASDGVHTTTQLVSVRIYPINDQPSFSVDSLKTVNEDSGYQSFNNWATNIFRGADNESDQEVSFTVLSNSNPDLFSLQPLITSDGTLTFTPADNVSGTATITVKLTDDGGIANGGENTSEEKNFQITVDPVNDVPSFTAGANQSVAEDAGAQTVAGWATAISAGPSNESAQTLTFAVTTGNEALFSVQPAISANGTLSYTLAANANGTATVSVVLKDNGGTARGGVDTSAAQTFTIEVTAVNDVPKAEDDTASVDEDSSVEIDVLDNDADVDQSWESDDLLIKEAVNGSNGTVTIAGDQKTLTYTPNADYYGTDSFTYTIEDKKNITSTATVEVTVNGVNDVPSFTAGATQSVAEDAGAQTVTGWATAISAGPSNESAQTLTFAVTTGNEALFSVQPAISANGTLSYTLAANANGTATVSVVLKDNGGTARGGVDTSAAQTFTIEVTAVNDVPKAEDDTASVDEDSSVEIDVLDNDADVDQSWESDDLLIKEAVNGSNGTVTIAGDQKTLTYTPNADYYGTDSFTYTIEDKKNITSTATVEVTVNGVNDVPSFTAGATQSVAEDAGAQTVTGWATAISAGPSNESAQTLTFAVTTGNEALFSVQPAISANGTLSYTLAANANGTATVSVVLKDNGGTARGGVDTSAAQTFTITVNAVNDAPKAEDDTASVNEDSSVEIDVLDNDTDVDQSWESDDLLIKEAVNGSNGTVTIAGDKKSLTYTPNADYNGTDSFTYTIEDKKNITSTATVEVTVNSVNDVPSFTAGANQSVAEDAGAQTVTGWATAISAGPADESSQELNFVVTANNPTLFSVQPAVSANGTLSYTLAENANGTATVSVVLKDNGGTARGGVDTSATQTFTIEVSAMNDAPEAEDDTASVDEDSSVEIDVLDNDTDVDQPWESDDLLIKEAVNGLNGTVTIAGDQKTLTYTPNAEYNGTDSFTYTIEDKKNVTSTATVEVTVNGVNDVPSFTAGANQSIAEDAGAQTVAGWATAISAGPSNESAQTLTFTVTNGNEALFSVQPTVSANGTLSYTLAENANGTATVSVVLKDNGGTARGGVDTSAAQTFTIEVTAVNDVPKAEDDTASVDEDSSVEIDVLDNDTDVDQSWESDDLLIKEAVNGSNGTVTIAGDQKTLTYTPNADYNGTDSFTYTVEDKKNVTSTATVVVTVNGVNDVPSFTAGANQSIAEDAGAQTVAGWATAISAGPSNESAQTLTFTVTNGNEALFSVQPTVSANGTLSYTPAENANGTATVSVVLKDNGGTARGGVDTSAAQTFTIEVTAVNDAPETNDDTASVNEDSSVEIDVLDNDTDADIVINGDSLTIISAGPATNGTATVKSGGLKIVYTPDSDWNGTDSFTYTISDGNGGTDTATVTVTVTAMNDAPEAKDDTASVNEDSSVEIDVLDNDTDLDGDDLTIISAGPATKGTVTVKSGGLKVVYTPDSDWNGTDSFTYTISDRNGGTDTATVTVTVNAMNDAPEAKDDTASVDEDSSVEIDVLDNDTDLDGDNLTISDVTDGNKGTAAISGGKIVYTPDSDWNGTDSFTYTISDGNGGTDTATVTVTVTAMNDAPEAKDDTASVNEDSSVEIDVLDNDTDLDGDDLTIISAGPATKGTATVKSGGLKVVYTPDSDWNGTDSFTYTISDGNGGTDTATVTVTVTAMNDAPEAKDDTASVNEDSSVEIDVLDNDTDLDGDDLTIISAGPATKGTVTVKSGGLKVVYTPDSDWNGTDSFTYTISDGNGGTDTATVTVTVNAMNDAPEAKDDTASVNEDSNVEIDVLDNDTDLDGDDLTIISAGPATKGTVTVKSGGLKVVYTPDSDWNGTDSFTYTISDGNGGTDTATVTVTVTAMNDAPEANDDTASVDEDSSVEIDVLDNDTDLDGDDLTIISAGPATKGTVTVKSGGLKVVYTPDSDWNGTDSFTYTISDGNGGTDTATVTVTVTAMNDAPEANDDTASVNEDSNVEIDVLDNDTDLDGDNLTIISAGSATNGTVTVKSGGLKVVYTPNSDWNGTDSFTYTISDGNGGTDTATVTVTVTAMNDAPEAKDDTASVNEDSNVEIDVLDNDTDLDGDDLTIISAGPATKGTVTVKSGGLKVVYTPNSDWNGTDSFTYTISDGNGGTDTATVTVTVTAMNDAPEAKDDTASVDEDSSVEIDVLDNDTDLDGDNLTISDVTNGNKGTAAISGGKIVYTPDSDWNGTDSFTYTISDGNGGTDTATVTVTVTAMNDAPEAKDDTASVNEDSSVEIDVLDNDTDLDGDDLTISSVTPGNKGTAVISGGKIVYTPDADWNGTDSFTYTISDGNGGTDTATVTVTVTAMNDAPEANDDTASVDEDGSVEIDVLDNDTDLDGDDLTISSVTPGNKGTAVISGGKIVYTPDSDWNGTDSFTYTISDGNGGTDTATVTVTVTAMNDAPEAKDDTASVNEDSSVEIDVLDNDTDLDGDDLSISSVTPGNKGTAVISGGKIVYTPDADWNGTDSFTYTISDGNGGTDTATVTVTVTAMNDAPEAKDDTASVNEDSNVEIDVLDNDTDLDGDDLTIILAGSATKGTVTVKSGGLKVVYTPDSDWNGTDSFTYTISDGNGGTDTATVTVTVNAMNDAPEAKDDTASVNEDGSVEIDVLDNDTDLDGDDLTISSVTPGNKGTAVISEGKIVYTPDADWNGTDSFTYTISDGNGGTDTATVTVTVNAMNDAPEAKDDTASVDEDGSVEIDVLDNDTDLDGDDLTISSVTPGNKGTAVKSGGKIVYTPDSDWNGTDSFTYTISDGNGGTDTATVTVTVTAINDPPLITGGTEASGDQDSIITGKAIAVDIDEDNLTYSKVSDPSNGNVVVKEDGSYTYIPRPGYFGTDSFQITVNDGNGGTDTATVTIQVNEVTSVDLYGSITDKLDGSPVNSATVELQDMAGNLLRTTVTTASGMYLFEDLEDTLYTIRVSHDAYSDNARQIRILYSNIVDGKTREDFQMSRFKISLTASPSAIVANGVETTVLTAAVTDENNNPVSGVQVQFSTDESMGSFQGGMQGITGADGKASVTYKSIKIEAVYNLAVPVTAVVEDYVREIFATDQILVTFAPGRINGIVTDSNNEPVEGARVVIKHFDSEGNVDFTTSIITGADGRYSFVIPKGGEEYDIEITKPIDIYGNKVEKTFRQKITAGEVTGSGNDQFDSERTVTGILGIFDTDRHLNLLTDKSDSLEIEVRGSQNQVISTAAVTISDEGIFNVTGLEIGSYSMALRYMLPDGSQLVVKRIDVEVGLDGEININEILIDPYGTVTENTSAGSVIEGAKVILYYADTARNQGNGLTPGAIVSLPAISGFPPADNMNPQETSSSGQYAFMVFPQTDYYLIATKTGYQTYTSPVISVYGEIVQHDFSMIEEEGEGEGEGEGGSGGFAGGGGGGGGSVDEEVEKDLAIVIYSDSMRVSQDGTVDFSVKYFNKSKVEVVDAVVTVEFPDEMRVSSNGDGKSGSGKIEWNLGTLAGGAEGTLFFTLKASKINAGQQMVVINSVISSSEDLMNTEDDSSKIQIMIYDEEHVGTHDWYIQGYPDGAFKSDNNLTRAETAAIFSRLLHLDTMTEKEASYLDAVPSHWAFGYIEAMTEEGLMKGMGEGNFMPDRAITRAELSMMIARYLDLERSSEVKPVESHFSDISQNWAQSVIEEIYRYQIVNGYEDGSFKPDSSLRRDEAVTIINRALYRGPIAVAAPTFPDVNPDYWAWGDIEESAHTHSYRIDGDGKEILVEMIP